MPDYPRTAFGEIVRYDDIPTPDYPDTPKNVNPLQEMGVTGLKRAAGVVDEEFLPALRGRKAIKVFQEMSLNDPIVGSLLFTIDKLCRQVTWRVEAVDNTPKQTQAADFLESCMDDMSHTWNDLISEILTMLVYGWSWHEIVYKRRVGPFEKDGSKKSKYTDGLIGWRKMPIRSQETLMRWMFDEEGGVQALVQLAPPHYNTTIIPIEKSLLFRTGSYKGNPEGQSLLRNAYRPWFFKKRLEEFEAIGVERDLAGMPVARIPTSYMEAPTGSKENKVFQSFKRMVQNVRRDEHEGLVIPSQFDRDTKQQLFEFELMASGGARSFDTNSIIQRYEQRILMTVLADFIMVGHEGTGSYALHVDKTGIFRSALNAILDSIADVFNRHAIPRLFEVNGAKMEELPKLVPNNVDPPDLTQLAQFMTAMGGLGMEWFPDAELEKFLRDTAHLPELPDEMLEMRRQMSMQHSVMSYASQQMEFLGLQQQAEMTSQGYSPQQAAMMQEQPTPEMQEQQLAMEQRQAEGQANAQMAGGQAQLAMDKDRAAMQEQSAGAQHARDMERMAAEDKRAADEFARGRQGAKEDDAYKDRDFKRGRESARDDDRLKQAEFRRQRDSAREQDKLKDRDSKRSAFLDAQKAKMQPKGPAPKPSRATQRPKPKRP